MVELVIPLQFGNVLDAAIDKNFTRVVHIILMVVLLFLSMTFLNYMRSWLDMSITIDTSKRMKTI